MKNQKKNIQFCKIFETSLVSQSSLLAFKERVASKWRRGDMLYKLGLKKARLRWRNAKHTTSARVVCFAGERSCSLTICFT